MILWLAIDVQSVSYISVCDYVHTLGCLMTYQIAWVWSLQNCYIRAALSKAIYNNTHVNPITEYILAIMLSNSE